MIVVSKYSTGGHISHTYTDHVSTLKFIEANWRLEPITKRSRDNLPNPRTNRDPYVPINPPAIGDMMDMFNFRHEELPAEHGHSGRFKLNVRRDRDPGPLDGAALFHWPIRRAAALFRSRYASPTTGLIAAAGLRGVRRPCASGIALARPLLQRNSARLAIANGARQLGGTHDKIMPVIMCGGSGTRMWPESRESRLSSSFPDR